MDRLRGLECFRKIAERGNFAAAARDLNMSPGSITKQINALEDMLGVQLISRTTRRLSLTEAGETYLSRISLILGAWTAWLCAYCRPHIVRSVKTGPCHWPFA